MSENNEQPSGSPLASPICFANLCAHELKELLNAAIANRNYARDCRSTQRDCKRKGWRQGEVDWDAREAEFDRRYKFYNSRVRYFRSLRNT